MSALSDVSKVRLQLLDRFKTIENKADILKAPELKALFAQIPSLEPSQRSAYGQAINTLSKELREKVSSQAEDTEKLDPIDVTAPFDVNSDLPTLLPSEKGSTHPLMQEIAKLRDVFERMGFVISIICLKH